MGNVPSAPAPLEKPEAAIDASVPAVVTPAIVIVPNYKPTPPEIPPIPAPEVKTPEPEAPKPITPPPEVPKPETPKPAHIPAWRRLGACHCEVCSVLLKPATPPPAIPTEPKVEPAAAEPTPAPAAIAEPTAVPVADNIAPVEAKIPETVPSTPVGPPGSVGRTDAEVQAVKNGWFQGWFVRGTASIPAAATVVVPAAAGVLTPASPPEPVVEVATPVVPPVESSIHGNNLNENVRKTCVRCGEDFEVPVSNAGNKLCGRQQCFNRADARRLCRYCNAEFVSLGADDHRVHCNAARCANVHARRHIYRQTTKYSVKAIAWMNSIAKRDGLVIYHAQNKGELCVDYNADGRKRFYYVDGFCEATGTVYEFYGDYYHGNPNKYKAGDVNKEAQKTFGQLYEDTMRREALLKSRYTVITIWESEYDTEFLTNALERQQ